MKRSIWGIILAASFALYSCKTSASEHVAKGNIKEIVNSPEATLVDVRIPEQYKAGTANNAVNIPLAEIENNIDFFKKQKNVVVFCNRGIQADKAIEILKKNGVENLYDGTTWKNVKAIQNEKPANHP
ncbi:rhodanese-like domain-containing protein [Chryseobacterium sp.]|uniref:rhodanese-like domain-containing protein n=1 Tax=Chryseobacterium sp. TaxID=1871047 RepID=UPI0025BEC963|nr:rhodanese-like domain-containing protein [Chryseobacterium sp.]